MEGRSVEVRITDAGALDATRPGRADGHRGHPDRSGEGRQVRERAATRGPGGNARVASEKATERAVLGMVRDNTQPVRRRSGPRRWLTDTALRLAYEAAGCRRRQPAETLRGCFSAPLAMGGARYWTLSNILDVIEQESIPGGLTVLRATLQRSLHGYAEAALQHVGQPSPRVRRAIPEGRVETHCGRSPYGSALRVTEA